MVKLNKEKIWEVHNRLEKEFNKLYDEVSFGKKYTNNHDVKKLLYLSTKVTVEGVYSLLIEKGYLTKENFNKLISKKLNSEKADKTCATKHVIPPKPKDSGILSSFT